MVHVLFRVDFVFCVAKEEQDDKVIYVVLFFKPMKAWDFKKS